MFFFYYNDHKGLSAIHIQTSLHAQRNTSPSACYLLFLLLSHHNTLSLLLILAVDSDVTFLVASVAGPLVLTTTSTTLSRGAITGKMSLLTTLEASVTTLLRLSLHATTIAAVASEVTGLTAFVALACGLALTVVLTLGLTAVTADVALLTAVVALFVVVATVSALVSTLVGGAVTRVMVRFTTVEAASLVFWFTGAGCPFVGAISNQMTFLATVMASLFVCRCLTLGGLGALARQVSLFTTVVALLRLLVRATFSLGRAVTQVMSLLAAVVASEGLLAC